MEGLNVFKCFKDKVINTRHDLLLNVALLLRVNVERINQNRATWALIFQPYSLSHVRERVVVVLR